MDKFLFKIIPRSQHLAGRTSDLQSRKIVSLCCSKPLGLWSFLCAATGSSYSDLAHGLLALWASDPSSIQ